MNWSLSFLLFAGIPVQPNIENEGDYFKNYHQAHRLAQKTQKPMLMILGTDLDSEKNPASLTRVRKTAERRKLLENYVVVVIDAKTPHGQVVRKAYKNPKLPHVVVLGKRQKYLIYHSSKELYGQTWTDLLKRHRDGNRIVPVRRVAAAYCNT